MSVGGVSEAVTGPGSYLEYENPASAGTWVRVGEVKDINGPTETTDEVDVTNQDSLGGFKETRATLQDGGTVTFDCNTIPGNAAQAALDTFKHAKTILSWRIRLTMTTPVHAVYFDGFINNLGRSFPISGVLTRSVGIRVSGPVTDAGYLGS